MQKRMALMNCKMYCNSLKHIFNSELQASHINARDSGETEEVLFYFSPVVHN